MTEKQRQGESDHPSYSIRKILFWDTTPGLPDVEAIPKAGKPISVEDRSSSEHFYRN